MKPRGRLALPVHLILLAVMAPSARADEPVAFQPALGESRWVPALRDVCWSEPVDLSAAKTSSEIISEKGWDCEVANDFILSADATITAIYGYGGYFGFGPPDSTDLTLQIRFYKDSDPDTIAPGALMAAYPVAASEGVRVGLDSYGFSTYRYAINVSHCVKGGHAYWLSFRALDHAFSGQWGRAGASAVTRSESKLRCPALGCPDWAPISSLLGYREDMAQELECGAYTEWPPPCGETPVRQSSWGAVRALFR
jgi:hypothetical protein